MDCMKMYNHIMQDLGKIKDDEKFDNLFLLTCLLIYNMSNQGDNLDDILLLLNEFDYKKNFREEVK